MILRDLEGTFEKRITDLNSASCDPGGDCVVYWMQKSQRAANNHALCLAIDIANDMGKPVCVYFGLLQTYPMGSERVFKFMLEGLTETASELEAKGVGFCMRIEDPGEGIVAFANEVRACAVITDEDYLRTGRQWRTCASEQLSIKMIQVDSDTIVPVRNQQKEEWGAYTIRPKIRQVLSTYLQKTVENAPKQKWTDCSIECVKVNSMIQLSPSLKYALTVPTVIDTVGGISEAQTKLARFIDNSLHKYADASGDIGESFTSGLSPYLHFGQISPLEIAIGVSDSDAPGESIDAFLEQLIVRRELAINFCFFNSVYDTINAAPNWAARTLENHTQDLRPVLYDLGELENCATHDELWNSAQRELVKYGRIHSYMRMLWAKKIAEWSPLPEIALSRAIFLNDKYALDGRDPNGYAGIAWSILGKHDRPFAERTIYGMVRYMSSESTKRRKRWKDYVARV